MTGRVPLDVWRVGERATAAAGNMLTLWEIGTGPDGGDRLVGALQAADAHLVVDALQQAERLRAELNTKDEWVAAHTRWCNGTTGLPPAPVFLEHGPERAITVKWPEGRGEWVPMSPDLLESIAHELTAHRTAEHLRSLPWWRRWRTRAPR